MSQEGVAITFSDLGAVAAAAAASIKATYPAFAQAASVLEGVAVAAEALGGAIAGSEVASGAALAGVIIGAGVPGTAYPALADAFLAAAAVAGVSEAVAG